MKTLSLAILIALSITACGRSGQNLPATPLQSSAQCVGQEVGRSFAADDGCNSCSCDEHGNMRCTLIACQ